MPADRTKALTALLEPRSIAIVGASEDPGKWGYLLAKNALAADEREVFLVNPRRPRLFGRPTSARLADLPESPDCTVIAVPSQHVEAVVDDALAAGARAIVAITAGFAEQTAEGRRVQQRLAERIRNAGAVLLGPNCMGVYNGFAKLDLAPWLAPPSGLPHGELAIVSQSGNLGVELARLAQDAGLGIGYFVSLGNQADLDSTDIVNHLARDPRVGVIVLYQEEFRRGRDLVAAWRRARAAGKGIMLLSVTDSPAAARAALSHTGSLASADEVIAAASRVGGAIRARTPAEAIGVASALRAFPRAQVRRVAVLSDGGGHGAVATALCEQAGCSVPELSEDTRAELRVVAPEAAAVANPIDLAGVPSIAAYEEVIAALARSGEVDAVLLTGNYGGFSLLSPDRPDWPAEEREGARRLAQRVRGLSTPVLVHAVNSRTEAAAELRSGGVPVFSEVGAAARVLALLAEDRGLAGTPCAPWPREGNGPPPAGAAAIPEPWSYDEARRFLASAGVEFPVTRIAGEPSEVEPAARELGYPVVLKAIDRVHKSDGGGVATGIGDDDALRRSLARMVEGLGARRFSVDREVDLRDGLELIVGARLDPSFGPVVMVGAGGLFTELFGDVAVALAPISAAEARQLLERLRVAPILRGARGRPALAIDRVAELAELVSRLIYEDSRLHEVEINPVLVRETDVVALDARVIALPAPEGEGEGLTEEPMAGSTS